MNCHRNPLYRIINKKDDPYFYSGFFCQTGWLTGFHLFNCSATLFKENAVPTIRTPDVNIYLNFLLTSCAFVRTCHT